MADLPLPLLPGAHRRRDLAAADIPPAEVRSPLWTQALPRRHAWAATDISHPRQRALVAASVLPDGGAVGGWAAAYLLGARRLDGSTPAPDRLEPVLLCMDRERQRPWWPGVRPFRSHLGTGDVAVADGVPVTSPLRTAFDLARLAPGVAEAVVADVLARDLAVAPGDVRDYARARPRWRGTPQVRRATPLVDARSASLQETRFRMLWVLDARLPPPMCNWPVLDGDGHLLGMVDLLDAEAALCGEYDGADHAAPDRRSLDHVRQEQLQLHGVDVVRVAGPDLAARRRRTVQRLRRRHARGVQRDRARDRWALAPAPGPLPPPDSSVSPLPGPPAVTGGDTAAAPLRGWAP